MKAIIEKALKIIARRIIERYDPKIIGITGSVGKTSAKDAVYAVLSEKFQCRRSVKNYNNEIGLPLTIIGCDSPGRSIWGWLKVFFRGWKLAISGIDYPEILILEMGADKPGDIRYLQEIVKCDIAIITKIGESHLEAFKTVDNIKKEKGLIVADMRENGWAILNFDDDKAMSLSEKVKNNQLSFGFGEGASVRAMEVIFSFEHDDLNKVDYSRLSGVNFKLKYKGSVVPVLLPEILGRPAIYSALAAAAVGVVMEMNLIEISQALKNYRPAKGRMNVVAGIKNTVIVDDTYNASPQASLEALDIFAKIRKKTGSMRYAVFGDMLELGSYTEEGHRLVGQRIAELKINVLIVVGERARLIAHGARDAGMSEDDIFIFSDNHEAGLFLQERIKEGDMILVKGSQGARMEKIVKEIMAEPLRAKELLVRQGEDWIGK